MSFKSAYRGDYGRGPGGHLYLDPASITLSTALTYVTIALLGGYLLVHQLDLFATLPLNQLAWNLLVYVAPPSLIIALEARATQRDDSKSYAKTRTFAAKSEAMRRILGLSVGGLSHATARSRSLSELMFKHSNSDTLPGLGNWDNSCYQNSILQGLSSLPSLRAFLEDADRRIPRASSRPTNLALSGLIGELNNPKNYGHKFWTPPVLKSMSSWQQQDAQEYYSKVVDALEKELGNGVAVHTGVKGLECLPAKRENANDAFPLNPLEGMLAQRVGCLRCGYVEGLSLIPFNCLTVPLGSRSMYELGECLNEYTSLEPINGVECPHCTLLRQKEILQKLLSKPIDSDSPTERLAEGKSTQDDFIRRLSAVNAALEGADFSDATLSKKCSIPSKQRVMTTKTRQAVIARRPRALAIHVNRSVFDEYTGSLQKNYANVRFSKFLDLSRWCLGGFNNEIERWSSNPAQSILDAQMATDPQTEIGKRPDSQTSIYALRAVITHQGRHENGHYIAFRRNWPSGDDGEASEQSWWRLSDEDVTATNEAAVLAQGGVFMLFYEQGTKKEQEEYIQSMKQAQVTHTEITSSKQQASVSTAAGSGLDSASPRPTRNLDTSPVTIPDPNIHIPLRASSATQANALPSSQLQSIISGITPPRRSSLHASPTSKSKGKSNRNTSPTEVTIAPSITEHVAANTEEARSPVIPERKASKVTKRRKKGTADSPRAVHGRTYVASNAGNSSPPLEAPRPGILSAQ